ncbi:MAG: fimbrillin family protein [Bacteroidales bacterium]|nr:fimbrillin family protein [Bacteroidales bacterium]
MKNTKYFAILAASLSLTACSNDEAVLGGQNTAKKGMELKATLADEIAGRANITTGLSNWTFEFTENDNISVTNSAIDGEFYTFKRDTESFTSAVAEVTEEPTDWFAFYPSHEFDLVYQAGDAVSAANHYGMIGSTASATTGATGLEIALRSQVAILEVAYFEEDGLKLNVKSGNGWVTALSGKFDAAGEPFFDVTTKSEAVPLLSVTAKGTYYVAVPAGIKLELFNGETAIRKTVDAGLVAGKHYRMIVGEPRPAGSYGTAMARLSPDSEEETPVSWTQLWPGGPKFADMNVGATAVTAEVTLNSEKKYESACFGGYYTWGGSIDKDPNSEYNQGNSELVGDDDTATKLWGSNWKMPSYKAFSDLINTKYTDGGTRVENYKGIQGLNGYVFKGIGEYAYNEIFLPRCGYYEGVDQRAVGVGHYWTSTSVSYDEIKYLELGNYAPKIEDESGYLSQSVRAILAEPISGHGEAIINGQTVIKSWVQLWDGGPKFATNVAVNPDDVMGYFSFDEANQTGKDFIWGENWHTPSKSELDGLHTNNYYSDYIYIWYTQKNDQWGFLFNGRGYYYNACLFVPVMYEASSENGYCQLWSSDINSDLSCGSLLLNYNEYGSSVNSTGAPSTQKQLLCPVFNGTPCEAPVVNPGIGIGTNNEGIKLEGEEWE